MEQQVLTCQRGHNNAASSSREEEEETRKRLSSLIRQKGLTAGSGRDDCHWVLLADSSRDGFVILEGIHESCCLAARNDDFQLFAFGHAAATSEDDDFQLVAFGHAAAASEDDGCKVFWPEAKDLARVIHKIMRKKRNAANDDSQEILQESAIGSLLIYQLVGCEAQFSTRAEEQQELEMLLRVLKPPSVLAPASPSLLARGHLGNTASSSSAPLALSSSSVGMDNKCSGAAGYELPALPIIMPTAGDGNSALGHHSVVDLMQELAAALPHFNTRSSGRGGRNDDDIVVPAAAIEFLVRRWWRDYDLEAQRQIFLADTNLDAGGQAHQVAAAAADGARHTGGDAIAPVQEPSDIAKNLRGVLVQALAAFLPTCVTASPQVKDAPDHVKFTIFGGLAFITVGLLVVILSKSVARRRLALRLVSFSAIVVMTFSVASQFSSPAYITLTALVGVLLNLIIMLLGSKLLPKF